ncbi:MAG: hypothetical protein GXO34_07685, partial [Deltaproteobacteria bacterium]|nr:hypothetical protein [Deltaproteobacteria bacterium]
MKSAPNNRPDLPPPGLCGAILDQAPYGIVVCRADGEITFANNLATFLLQCKAAGDNLYTIISENADQKNFTKNWQELLNNKRNAITLQFSLPLSQHDNRDSQLSLHITSLRGEFFDASVHVLAFIEDLSSKETLLLTDQHYTDSLEQLVNETNK